MSEELPKGWALPQLAELFDFVIGGVWGEAPDIEDEDLTHAYCIRGTEFRHWDKEKGETRVLRKVNISSLEKRKLQKGDILIEISGGGPDQPVGRTVLIDAKSLAVKPEFPSVCTNFIRLVRPSAKLDAAYLNYYLKTFYLSGEVNNYQGGSNNLRNLKFNEYCTIPVPLAPLREQICIANKLDSLLAKVDAAQTHLEKIPTLLKRFRQSVLAAATSGELTNEWRELGSLPVWRYITLNEGFECIDGDRGPNYPKKGDYLESGDCLFLSTKNVRQYGLSFNETVYISKEKDKQLRKGKLSRNDVVITTRGTLGFVGLYDDSVPYENVRINSGMLILRKKTDYEGKFVVYLISSPYFQKEIENKQTGSAQPQLPANIIKEFLLPLPSLHEQKEIVRRVESLFALADNVEKHYAEAKKRTDHLTQSLLTKAFRGELVTQDPNDEPASELLKRIQAMSEAKKSVKEPPKGSVTRYKAPLDGLNKRPMETASSNISNRKKNHQASVEDIILEKMNETYKGEEIELSVLLDSLNYPYEELKKALFNLTKGDLNTSLKPRAKLYWDGVYKIGMVK